ncbi:Uncharacterized glutathione S-transferase-like protein [Candidatus Phaeomarinobacter ectocarpi]|uniref:Uncharacterized glutathione S-transferase-like protein n=1 Tax=Candidatus Phaeomarinibacter ectocarpi TaxID=1458461 RepID=X5MD47_9HYPH|nr:glutathione S-transferase family protein [Candidatus Phaeomarinobacter ectocarpi]CDO59867.1 Uncharacterized glutathione S-transferase-like protein [Candidatus Phaeomarinobacter ectocarpi]
MLTVWGRRNSQNVQKVMWLIGELGLEHTHIDAGSTFGGLDTPDFLARNPHGKIPVIEDENGAVWESHAILRYLAAQHDGDTWWPADPYKRSVQDRWIEWATTTLQVSLLEIFWAYYRTPEDKRNAAFLKGAFKRCHAGFTALNAHLEGTPYIAGDSLTLADMPAGATLFRYLTMPIDRPSLPHVEALYARLSEREAYRTHVMVPYDDLFGRMDY